MKRSNQPDATAQYRIGFKQEALVEWNNLDGSVKEMFRSLLRKRLMNPHVPGSALEGDLRGCYKIKLRKLGYRLVYTVLDEELVVLVVAVGKREESITYRVAVSRLGN